MSRSKFNPADLYGRDAHAEAVKAEGERDIRDRIGQHLGNVNGLPGWKYFTFVYANMTAHDVQRKRLDFKDRLYCYPISVNPEFPMDPDPARNKALLEDAHARWLEHNQCTAEGLPQAEIWGLRPEDAEAYAAKRRALAESDAIVLAYERSVSSSPSVRRKQQEERIALKQALADERAARIKADRKLLELRSGQQSPASAG